MSLLVGGAVLIYMCRDQWFFYDDWAFIGSQSFNNLWAPHGGHWSSVPYLIFWSLTAVFGLKSLPFLIVFVACHLFLVHVVWRLAVVSGVQEWIATIGAITLIFLAPGYENIVWFFQIGFVLGLALPLWGLLVVCTLGSTVPNRVAVGVLLTLGLASSGTSLPITLIVCLLTVRFWGLRPAATALTAPVALYLIWFGVFGIHFDGAAMRATGWNQILVGVPQFASNMMIGAFGQLTPNDAIGSTVFVLAIIWLLVSALAWPKRQWTLGALALSGMIFALLSGYSRLRLGMFTALSSRYLYAVLILVFPLVLLFFTWLCRSLKGTVLLICIALAALAVYNLGALKGHVADRVSISQESYRTIREAYKNDKEEGFTKDPGLQVDPKWAPDLTYGTLRELVNSGKLVVSRPSDAVGEDRFDTIG